MAQVDVTIEETVLEGEYGDVDSVTAECGKCGHTTESFGTGEGSRRRCLALMRDECPSGERNFYVD